MLDLIATQWTTPTTPAQRPLIMWCDWTDIMPWVVIRTVRISDAGGNIPAQLTFTAYDGHGTLGRYITQNQRVLFWDTLVDKPLFHGFVKNVRPTFTAAWAKYEVTCTDLSSLLDEGLPIETMNRPAESDRARIGAVLAYSTWSSMAAGGFVQQLNAAMSGGDFSHATVRTGVEDTLQRSGASPVGYHVDGLGYLHTYSSADGGAAPYAISDTPNYTTTIPAVIQPEYDGAADADYAFVYGGTQAGTGVVGLPSWAPRFPARYRPVDAPDSIDAATLANVGTTELGNGHNVVRVTVVITEDQAHGAWRGWAKGQSIAITNALAGWVGQSFIICGVDLAFLTGTGLRRYTLTCGVVPLQRLRLIHHINQTVKKVVHKRIHHKRIRGHRGAPKVVG